MFKFLKDKLKGAIASLSKKVEAEPLETPPETQSETAEPIPNIPVPEKKGIFQRLKESVTGPSEKPEAPVERLSKEAKKVVEKVPKEEKLDAERIESIIRDVDIHAPLQVETEPEPVPELNVEAAEAKVAPPEPLKKKVQPKQKVEPKKTEVEPEIPKIEIPKQSVPEALPEKVVEKKGFFGRIAEAISTKKISADEFQNLFWELEVVLLENNVAVEVIEKIKEDLARSLVDTPIPRGKVEQQITQALRTSIHDVLSLKSIDLVAKAREKKPFIITFVGVNGSGKTTTIAKVAHLLLEQKLSVVLAAGDTFRAAAIDQLDMHAKKLGVKIVKHDYGADPAAVAFDAIKHAQAKHIDVVLIDTAGRLHSNINLVDEMKKIIRVAKPDMKIFVGESITGNDCVEQAQQFDEAIGIDGIILTKADVDEKGGAAISVSYVTKKPILYLGMGQEYADLVPFDGEQILNSIGLTA